MRPSTLLTCLLSVSLVSGCTLVGGPVAVTPRPTAPTLSSPTTPAPETDQTEDASPFGRLDNPAEGQELTVDEYYTDASGSLRVSDVAITASGDTDQDGAPNYQVQAQVDLGERGVHDVEILENDAPASSGQLDSFTVTDTTASSSFVFELTPDNGNAIVRSGDSVLTFLFTDDNQVIINDQAPVSMEEAVQQLAQFAVEGEVSPHALAMLYARIHRSSVDTQEPTYNTTSFALWVMNNRLLLESFLLQILLLFLSFGTFL